MSKRRQLSGEQKVAIIRAHLLDGVPVSELCDKHKIHATQFYAWQKQLFENGASAFERKANGSNVRRQQTAQEQRISQLETKLQDRNEVVAELLEEHVKLKKSTGEL